MAAGRGLPGQKPRKYLTCMTCHSIIRADAPVLAAPPESHPYRNSDMHFSLRQAYPASITIRPSLPVAVMLLALACTGAVFMAGGKILDAVEMRSYWDDFG